MARKLSVFWIVIPISFTGKICHFRRGFEIHKLIYISEHDLYFRAWESPIFTNKTFRTLVLASKNRPNKIEELRDYYMDSLPLVAPDEILIDKNCEYVVGPENHVEDIAKAIKIINPNIKIITFVCDPNLRVVSKLLGSLPNVWPKLIR